MTQQQIIRGDCIGKLETLFLENNWKSVLLVTGKKSYDISGSDRFFRKSVSNLNLNIYRFCDFVNNPNIGDLKKGLELSTDFSPEVIVAIGGGSALDMGKLLRFFLTNKGEIIGGDYVPLAPKLPLIAIPATAGTGAEITHFVVIYEERGKKHSIAHPVNLPDYVVINPELTYNTTPYVTACSGFDALAQWIEAYWNKNATAESDEYALKAIKLILNTLPEVVTRPSPVLRDKMAEGAFWAGKAINITKTTAPHAFSYPFTSYYNIPHDNIPHGHAVAIVFPTIAEYNLKYGNIPSEKTQYLTYLFGEGSQLRNSFKEYTKKIGLATPDINFDRNLLLEGISLERLANYPVEISESAAIEILNKIFVSSNWSEN